MFPAKTFHYTLKRGLQGHDVWALQINLNALPGTLLVTDGDFGPATEAKVKAYQKSAGLTVDGIAGPVTQRHLALKLATPYANAQALPDGLLRGLIEGESGYFVGAVVFHVATPTQEESFDCGWIQRNIRKSNYSDNNFRLAFSGPVQFALVAKELRTKKNEFFGMVGAQTDQRAWELALLNHNFPAAAQDLAEGKKLSDAYAQWVVDASGGRVSTVAEWAEYYIKTKTQYVTSWTS